MTDTNELRKLLEKATPRPWIVQKDDYWDSWSVTGPAHEIVPGWPRTEPKAFDDGSACGEYGPSCTEATRDLIVAAVNALPALLDELEERRAEGVQCEIALAETEHELNQARAEVDHLRARVDVLERVSSRLLQHIDSGGWVEEETGVTQFVRDLALLQELRAAIDAAKETP